jgi:hypothetical protein
MVLKLGADAAGQRVSLPWESIDPQDGLQATEADGEAVSNEDGVKWFTSAPPGEWEMDGPAPAAEPAEDITSNTVTPFDSVNDVQEEETDRPRSAGDGGGWTVAILCMGLGVIAACIVIPQADANRRLVYEREQLKLDLNQVQKQIGLNKEFLLKMESDPQLTERLAQREMRSVKQGEAVVDLGSADNSTKAMSSAEKMSPFGIVNVPPPPALAPYKPVGGAFAELCRDQGSHMYLLGAGMMMVAVGLTLGGSSRAPAGIEPDHDEDFSDDRFSEPN